MLKNVLEILVVLTVGFLMQRGSPRVRQSTQNFLERFDCGMPPTYF